MSCYHPLKAFVTGINPETGKKKLKVTSYDIEEVENKNWKLGEPHFFTEFIEIPCGQCVGCRLDYSKQWANRCMLESEYHDNNYFLTLTYNDEHLVKTEYFDKDTGEIKKNNGTLIKSHLQQFNKTLRSQLSRDGKNGFRFYACGEYGTESARPHYHMIAFGLELDDLKFYKNSKLGMPLYTSELLSSKWEHGYVIIGAVSYESCAYVSRYIMKKQKGKTETVYDYYNIAPEFVNMSRKPGIGRDYFDDNYTDIYPRDSIVLSGGKLVKPPRYFDNLMDKIDEELMGEIKEKRRDIAESIQAYKDTLTTENYLEQLKSAERNKERQVSKLVRPLKGVND